MEIKMKSLTVLENANKFLNETLSVTNFSNIFVNKEIDRTVCSLTLSIKKELKIDYSKTLNFKPKEKERLLQIYINYLIGKNDEFNSHYIQLLAWHIQDLKVMSKKIGKDEKGEIKYVNVSIFEYSPNLLNPFSVIEKTFKLFNKKRIDVNKISFALIMNYLNNYKIASNRYKKELKKYLRAIKFCDDLDIYFDFEKVIINTINKTEKQFYLDTSFPKRLQNLKISPRTLDTVYFADAWLTWMLQYAKLWDENIIKELNCSFFKICNEDYQKILFAKIIYMNNLRLKDLKKTELLCVKYIFPLIKKGSPLIKEFWSMNYTGIYKQYLDVAWNFIEQTFVNNSKYKHMINFEE
jgi:hypothetical protein